MECSTIDEMMARLEALKQKHGGGCRVRLNVSGHQLLLPNIHEMTAGKSDERRLVSRGGVPCVVISA